MRVGSFGQTVFEVSTDRALTPSAFSREVKARYEEHKVLGAPPRLEYVCYTKTWYAMPNSLPIFLAIVTEIGRLPLSISEIQFWLAGGVDELTKLLLCLPNIAESMAGKAGNAKDAQGWMYLQSMFHHWFSGKGSTDAVNNPEPLWVSWHWVMRYARALDMYKTFINPWMPEYPYIANYAAQQQLGKILQRSGLLQGNGGTFDFINSDWTQWEGKYHTLIAVPRIPDTDGLMAALAGFTLRALAKGRFVRKSEEVYTIYITQIAVFVHDKFQFEQDSGIGTNNLGWWSCKNLDGAFVVNPDDSDGSYHHLYNETLRNFRSQYNNGGDFLVLSQPHFVDTFKEISYEYTCR